MIKKWVHFLIFFCATLGAQDTAIEHIKQKYQSYIDQMNQICLLGQADQYAAMPNFFKSMNTKHSVMVKQVHTDLSTLKKNIRQCKKKKIENALCSQTQYFADTMQKFYKFLKKYRILYEVVYFEQQVWGRFDHFFQAVRNGFDVESLLVDFGIQESGRDGLKILLKSVVKNLATVEYDERRLHADWIDAKLSNYVLKIELVRLRNAILFHPTYKKNKFVFSSNYPR